MTVYDKNGKWYCRFQLDGERVHRLCAGATNDQEAEKIENGFKYRLQQQQNGIMPRAPKKISFNNVCDDYERYAKLNHKSYKTTSRAYIAEFRTFFGCIKDINEIKPYTIENFKEHLLCENRTKTTVNRYLEGLGKLFNIAVENEKLTKSPYSNKMKFKEKNYVVRYLSVEEEIRLFKAAPPYFRELIFMALQTGQREANILYLQGKNIKCDMRIIELPETKGGKYIKVYMNDAVYKFLKGKHLADDEYLFLNPRTQRKWCYTAFWEEWTKIKTKAGIINFRFHDLRHTAGTRLAEKGVPVPVIQDIFKHSDTSTTMRYVHTAEQQKQDAMNVLCNYGGVDTICT